VELFRRQWRRSFRNYPPTRAEIAPAQVPGDTRAQPASRLLSSGEPRRCLRAGYRCRRRVGRAHVQRFPWPARLHTSEKHRRGPGWGDWTASPPQVSQVSGTSSMPARKLIVLSCGHTTLDLELVLTGHPGPSVVRHLVPCTHTAGPDGKIAHPIYAYVIQHESAQILVDTGMSDSF